MWGILAILPLTIIIFQDFKYRAISWWTLPVLAVFLFLYSLNGKAMFEIFQTSLLNLGVLFFQFIVLIAYFSLKNRKLTNIFKHYMGIGDLFFLVVLSVFFEVYQFLFFEIFSLVGILLGSLFFVLFRKNWSFKIPLAGLQSAFLIIYIVYLQLA